MKPLYLCIILLGLSFSARAQSGDYDIRKVCMGSGQYAAVVEYEKQYYVIVSRNLLLTSHEIVFINGNIRLGGSASMEYFDGKKNNNVLIDILSHRQWRYAGYSGAKAICRQVVNR